jgi:hypothetical protein
VCGMVNASYRRYSHKGFLPLKLKFRCSAGVGIRLIVGFCYLHLVLEFTERYEVNVGHNGMNGLTLNTRGLNLAAVKHTTVQVTRLPL